MPNNYFSTQTVLIFFVFLFLPYMIFGNAWAKSPGRTETLESVIVVSQKVDDYIKKSPNLTISMEEKEIHQRNFLQVYEVLASMTGVDIKPVSTGLGARISIRGGGGSGSVLVLIDGRPMNTGQYGGIDLGSIPIDIVKKITVFKPPVPTWLGPGSSAGAIYIELKKGKTDCRKDKQAELAEKPGGKKGLIRFSSGSFGLINMSGSVKMDEGANHTLLAAGYGHKQGKKDNSQLDKGYVSFNWNKADNSMSGLQVNGKYYVSNHGVAGPAYNPTPNAFQKYERASLDFKVKGILKEQTDYDVKAYVHMTRLEDKADSGAMAGLDAYTMGVGTDFFQSDDKGKKEYRFGTIYENNYIDHTLTGSHNRHVLSVHGVQNLRYDPVVVTFGLRGDYVNDFGVSPAGNMGVSYAFFDHTLIKASAGFSENIPTFGQLYQPSHGSMDQVRGNLDLDKEKILGFNLSLLHTFMDENQFEISFFRTDTWDLIKYTRGTDLITRPANIDHAWKQGLETSLKLKLDNKVSLDINYIWQQTENKDNQKELSYAPAHTLKVTVKAKLKSGIRLEAMTRAYSRQFTDTDNKESEKISGYATTDIKLIQPLSFFTCPCDFFIHVINIFDKDYDVHYGYPDDGIRFLCGISMNF
ncbi:MAG: TonB-dependent receptor [Desulfobacula sp.]|nr:TonB-dependent receptor [Desulfobacula sp.]